MVEFYVALFIMLAGAWVLGEVFQRLRQPALVGQLLAGILMGPSLLNLVQPTQDLTTVENVAIFFILLLTGLAVKPAKIIKGGRRGALVSSISFVLPFIAGVEIARFFGVGIVSSFIIGLTVSITAVPVNAIVLMELGLLDTELGTTVIAAGVIDDIISFIALGMIRQFASGVSGAGEESVIFSLVKVGLFLGAFFVCERFIQKNLVSMRIVIDQLGSKLKTPGSFIAILIFTAVGVSLLAEWAGIQPVIGAFFAGFLLSDLVGAEKLQKADEVIRGATFGFFGPIAFTFIGTEFVFSSIVGIPLFIVTLLSVAVASKLLGGYVAARLGKFSGWESVSIGLLMNSRGFVELVIASTAYQSHLINQSIFSLVVGVGVITTIISPIATRIAIRRTRLQQEERLMSEPRLVSDKN